MPEAVTESYVRAFRAGDTKYCDASGAPELREAIASRFAGPGRGAGRRLRHARLVPSAGRRPAVDRPAQRCRPAPPHLLADAPPASAPVGHGAAVPPGGRDRVPGRRARGCVRRGRDGRGAELAREPDRPRAHRARRRRRARLGRGSRRVDRQRRGVRGLRLRRPTGRLLAVRRSRGTGQARRLLGPHVLEDVLHDRVPPRVRRAADGAHCCALAARAGSRPHRAEHAGAGGRVGGAGRTRPRRPAPRVRARHPRRRRRRPRPPRASRRGSRRRLVRDRRPVGVHRRRRSAVLGAARSGRSRPRARPARSRRRPTTARFRRRGSRCAASAPRRWKPFDCCATTWTRERREAGVVHELPGSSEAPGRPSPADGRGRHGLGRGAVLHRQPPDQRALGLAGLRRPRAGVRRVRSG